MKKFLDILIISLLFVLLINLFTSDNNNKDLNNTLNLSFSENSYTIPASVGIKIDNQTSENISINTCEDLSISYAGEKINLSENLCENIEVISGENYLIDLSNDYSKFENIGKYTLNSTIGEKEYIDQTEIEYKGGISKVFIALFYAPIYNLIIGLIEFFSGSFGWAIVGITIIIRIILLWPQHKMMISQKKLQALQPKIKKIQEEYKGNQQMLGMKMMELYKKEKVNPMGSCGFLLIQMPILIVLYHVILEIKDPSSVFYLYSFLEGFSLDIVNYNFYGLELLSNGGVQGAVLAITVALIQFFQIRLSIASRKTDEAKTGVVLEKKSGSDKYSQMMPDPEMLNKFMLWGMPAIVGVFTFTLIAGVGIYWGISTLFMLIQQLIVNKILQK